MDGIKEMLDRLSDLNEGELSDLEGKIIGEFESVEKEEPTAQVVDQMTALADALDAVRGEQSNRVNSQKDLERRAAEAAARVKPQAEEDQADGQTPADDAAPVPDDAAPPVPDDTTVPVDDTAPAPVDDTAPPPDDTTTPPADDTETPAEDVAPDEEEDPKKKQAVPSTFEADEKTPEPETTQEAPAATAEQPAETPAEAAPVAPAAEAAPEAPAAVAVVVDEAAPATSTDSSAPTEEIPVAASATDVVVTPPAENRPVPRASATVSITAGADIPGISAGTEFASSNQVAEAFVKRLHNLSRVSQPNGQQYTVATLTASFPEDRYLESGDVDGNWDKIQKVAGQKAIVAAAGACLPLEIKYDIYGIGDTDTPVQDSLARFTADRGGIRFYPGPLLPGQSYYKALGVWDPTVSGDNVSVFNDDGTLATNSQAEKPCYPVECLPFTEAVLEAVTMCMCFDNLTGRVFPELVARHNELALVQHARVTEQYMLGKLKAGATTQVTATGTLSAAIDLLTQVDRVAATLRYRNRISPTQSFRTIFPYWVKDMIRSDMAMRMPGDGGTNMAVADNQLEQWFRARNINVTWSLETAPDGDTPTDFEASTVDGNGLPVPGTDTFANNCDWWPAHIEWDMFAEGTWLVLDGGTLDLGVIRDSEHVANNTYCEFTESFYNLARVGGESVHVKSALRTTGSAADLSDACA